MAARVFSGAVLASILAGTSDAISILADTSDAISLIQLGAYEPQHARDLRQQQNRLLWAERQNPSAFEDGEGPQTIFPAGCEPKCYEQNKSLAELLGKYVAKSGGRAQIQFVGDSTVESIWKKFNESGNGTAGLELVYVMGTAITTASASWFSTEATATLFNFGLHCLHVHPYRSCVDDHPSLYQDCGNYADTFATVADLIHTRAPKSKMVWKTTSHVCPSKFEAELRDGLLAWHYDEAEASAANTEGSVFEDICEKDCPQFAEGSGRRCEDELFNDVGVKYQHDVSMKAVGKLDYDVSVLDAWEATTGLCDETLDGKHYASFDWDLALQLARML